MHLFLFCKTVNFFDEELLFLVIAHKVIQNFGLLCLSLGIYNPQDLQKALVTGEVFA